MPTTPTLSVQKPRESQGHNVSCASTMTEQLVSEQAFTDLFIAMRTCRATTCLAGILISCHVAGATARPPYEVRSALEVWEVFILRVIADLDKDVLCPFFRAGWRQAAKCMQPSTLAGKQRSIRHISHNWTCQSWGSSNKGHVMWVTPSAQKNTTLRD
jgi:hypothetical protein